MTIIDCRLTKRVMLAMTFAVLPVLPAFAGEFPALSDVPENLADRFPVFLEAHSELQRERDVLGDYRARHDLKCANVIIGSAASAVCQREAEAFSAAFAEHVRHCEEFNAALRATTASLASNESVETYRTQTHQSWEAQMSQPWWGK